MKTKAIFLNLIMAVSITTLTSSCMMMHQMPMPVDNMSENKNKNQNGHSNSEMKMTKDLVCGMQVGTNTTLTFDHEGNTYNFDSEECLKAFQKNPQRFVKREMKMNKENNKVSMSKAAIWGGVAMGAMMIVMMTILIAN